MDPLTLIGLVIAFLGTVAQLHQAVSGSEALLREIRDVLITIRDQSETRGER